MYMWVCIHPSRAPISFFLMEDCVTPFVIDFFPLLTRTGDLRMKSEHISLISYEYTVHSRTDRPRQEAAQIWGQKF
jgi:hypothetical protein